MTKSDRLFFSTAAALILAVTLTGFWAFYTSGHGENGRVIAPAIFPVVLVHGLAVTAWYVLSLVQSLLVAGGNQRLHMKLGWSAIALLPVITVSGVLVAIRSAQGAPGFVFFGMNYAREFLLVMLTEIVVFTLFVSAGLLRRRRPEVHRAMMLSASLSLLFGATTRIPGLVALFGGNNSRVAFFGPVFVLAAVLVLVRCVLIRRVDRWLAGGYAFTVVVYLGADQVARTEAWQRLAAVLLKT